jgi:pyruvate/2-oxoglutarate dehydrogenase complex dihydrolipoamide acyltransferase (E2) component
VVKILFLCGIMNRIGKYKIKSFSRNRQNVALIASEGWRKHSIHAILEVDVTKARQLIHNYKEKTGESISFTGWIAKCIGQALSENIELNAYRLGKRKIVIFDDVDIAIPIERFVDGEYIPMGYIIRKVNKKGIKEITKEIRTAQKEAADKSTQVLIKNITWIEKFVLNSPVFIKKLLLWILRRNGILKKKYMGTVGLTAIGMIGKFSGGIIPLGGTTAILVTVGGIKKKPGVVANRIEIREYLNMTVTFDHDIVDGGPLARFTGRLTELMENAFGLTNLKIK